MLLLLAALAAAALAAPAPAAAQLRTGVFDPGAFASQMRQERAFDRTRATGSTMVRLSLYWQSVAPETRPVGFDPAAPGSPHYNWGWFDRQVRLVKARGLEPLVEVIRAPTWAEGPGGHAPGFGRVDPVEFGNFARAAALRYSGSYGGLPRVRHWLAWAEPNRDYFLMPQYEGGRISSALLYRSMVKHFAAGVRSVHPTNVVVGGALAPYGRQGKPAPLAFMREMLCLSPALRPTCNLRSDPVRVDVWAHHAYTMGGPSQKTANRDDIALSGLPRMRNVLRAAVRAGHLAPRGQLGFWVTEFSWDTKPPDPRGVPTALHARWTSEALFRMWQSGVSVAIWWQIDDEPLHASVYQSGFFTVNGARKRSLTAFRFPVVAFKRGAGVYVWGRTPFGKPARVTVQVKTGRNWRRLGVLRTNQHGIFAKTFRTNVPRSATVRAVYGREVSVPFSLTPAKNRTLSPFGCGGGIPC